MTEAEVVAPSKYVLRCFGGNVNNNILLSLLQEVESWITSERDYIIK